MLDDLLRGRRLGNLWCGRPDVSESSLRIIVPFAAGGPNDVAARLVAEALGPHLGQSVVVENRGGAGGLVGAEAVARSEPDGTTLLFGTIGPLVISPSAKALRYDPARDFNPIGQVYRSAQVFSASPARGHKTVAEFISYAKDNPGKITIGTAGIGTLPHLTTELLKRDAAVNVTHVPYRGTNAALADLIAGQIDAIFGEVSVMAPNIKSGKAIALSITSPERSKLLPSVPTMSEVGIPFVDRQSWGGLLAPARVPADVLTRLEQSLQKALREPSVPQCRGQAGLGARSRARARSLPSCSRGRRPSGARLSGRPVSSSTNSTREGGPRSGADLPSA